MHAAHAGVPSRLCRLNPDGVPHAALAGLPSFTGPSSARRFARHRACCSAVATSPQ